MSRFLAITLIDWPLTRWRRSRQMMADPADEPDKEEAPFALTESGVHGLRVVCANKAARADGVTDGLGFTDGRARSPTLTAEPVDREADRRALKKLARWMGRWSPIVALDGEAGLLLETTGCDQLFGGETAMLDKIRTRLNDAGIPHRLGLAGTVGAAIALSLNDTGPAPVILSSGGEKEGLRDLPVGALRLSAEAVRLLHRFGLNRIGQLYPLDRRALARRFPAREAADAVTLRLDQALGHLREPLTPLISPPDWQARLPCPEPLISSDGVAMGLEKLAHLLLTDLSRAGLGARRFVLAAYRADGTSAHLHVRTARPERDPARLCRLFRERIDRIDPGFGIDLLQLSAHRTGTMAVVETPLSGDIAGAHVDEDALGALADRLTSRLGDGAVSVTRPMASHLPERSEYPAPFDGAIPAPLAAPANEGPRPLRLLDRPEPLKVMASVPDGPPLRLTWRRVPRRIARADGPERLAPEWWKLSEKGARARDYYRIEDEEGRRYWVFREGLYDDGRGGPPQWFMHGLFP